MPEDNVLLHACCAPCSGPVIPRLRTLGKVTVFFSNANIHPAMEYTRRRDELAAYCARLGIPFIEDDNSPALWRAVVKGLEHEPEKGLRCTECFRFRLQKSAFYAKTNGFSAFATTLTVSPHKNSALLLSLGQDIALEQGIAFIAMDFKKKDGFRQSLLISEQEDFYRQNYCGCVFSLR